MLGGVIAADGDHREVFDILRPGIDLAAVAQRRRADGSLPPAERWFEEDDLYPDVRPSLRRLGAAGVEVGIAANQPVEAAAGIRSLGIDPPMLLLSDAIRLWKPDPAFYQRVVAEAGCAAHEVLYVGDRVDNDVIPATTAGLRAVHLRRGPWGYLHAHREGVERAVLHAESLGDVVDALV